MKKPLKVLILEDSEDDTQLVLLQLEQEGIAVEWQRVETEEEFHAALDTHHPDLILSDYSLPNYNGIKALTFLNERGLDIPFILVSGTIGEDVAVTALQHGAADYLLKDRLGRLGGSIARALEQKRLRAEKKKAEQDLAASETELRALFASMHDNVLVIDRNGVYQKIAPTRHDLLVIPPQELLGKTLRDVFPAEQAETFMSTIRQVMETQQSAHIEYPLVVNGQEIWFETAISPMNEDNTLWVARNITERRRAEEALRLSEARFRLALDNSPLTVSNLDRELRYTWMYNSQSGFDPQFAIGKTDEELLSPEDGVRLTEIKRRVLETGVAAREEAKVTINGQTIFHDLFIEPWRDISGNVIGLTCAEMDITERKQAEQEIESLAKFPYENIGPVLRFARDGRLLYANPASADLLKTWGCTIGDRPPDEIQVIIYEALVLGMKPEIEVAHGDTLDALSFVPVVDQDYVNVYGRDITERKQAEKKLLASEVRYRRLFESSKDGILILDAETGEIVDVNPFLIILLGYSKEAFLGKNIWDLGFFKDIVANKANFLKLQQKEYIRYEDLPLETASGRMINVEFVSSLYEVDHHEVIQCNIRDITVRKKAEEQIQRQLKRLNSLRAIDEAISSSFDIHVTLNIVLQQVASQLGVDACAILLFNPQLQMIEYAASRGVRYNAIQHAKLKLGAGFAGRAVLERRTMHIFDLMATGGELAKAFKLADENFVDYYGAPLIVKGEVKGVLELYHRFALHPDPEWLDFLETLAGQAAIAIDNAQLFENLQRANTELEERVAQRTAELNKTNVELGHANRAKDEFLATMSHELRTPLNSILGLSETLLEQMRDPLSEYQQKSLQIIASSGGHLLELINDILDLSKIEAGKFDYYPQLIEVDDLCRSSLTFVKEQSTRKSITLTYQLETTVSKMYADPRRLKQVLVNLLTNAVKFTPNNGQVILQVHSDMEQDRIQFSVIDTGIGIAPKDLQQLFVPFVQVDSRLTREYEGTGLGLALVQKLTDLHGGSVDVESEVGKGSRFTINLPLGQAMAAQEPVTESGRQSLVGEQAVEPNTPAPEPLERGIILLAEDNMANILTIGDYLESHGYQIMVAHDGLEAIEKAEMLQPDIILMDIQMPVLDGLEAIRRLRALPRFATTPIIALTALAMSGDRERCLEAGANEYISKPVSLKALIKTIEAMLKF